MSASARIGALRLMRTGVMVKCTNGTFKTVESSFAQPSLPEQKGEAQSSSASTSTSIAAAAASKKPVTQSLLAGAVVKMANEGK